jgi:peroxiredoxin
MITNHKNTTPNIRGSRNKWPMVGCWACVITALLLASCTLFAQPKTGQKAPDIMLPDVNGTIQKLADQAGKVVLIDFWASWCEPCRRSNPGLVKLYEKYKQKGFEIYSISIDENKSSWKKAITTDKMSWTHVIAEGGWDGPVGQTWKIQQIPASYLLDKSGKIVAIDPNTRQLEKDIIEQLK